MTKNDFILKAAEWFLFDNHLKCVQILSEAEDHARYIDDVCYKFYAQEMTAKQILTEIHDLAAEFHQMYELGKQSKQEHTLEKTLELLKKVKDEREQTSLD